MPIYFKVIQLPVLITVMITPVVCTTMLFASTVNMAVTVDSDDAEHETIKLTIVRSGRLAVEVHGLPVVILYRGNLFGASCCSTWSG